MWDRSVTDVISRLFKLGCLPLVLVVFLVEDAAGTQLLEEINANWDSFFEGNGKVTEASYAGKLVKSGELDREETAWFAFQGEMLAVATCYNNASGVNRNPSMLRLFNGSYEAYCSSVDLCQIPSKDEDWAISTVEISDTPNPRLLGNQDSRKSGFIEIGTIVPLNFFMMNQEHVHVLESVAGELDGKKVMKVAIKLDFSKVELQEQFGMAKALTDAVFWLDPETSYLPLKVVSTFNGKKRIDFLEYTKLDDGFVYATKQYCDMSEELAETHAEYLFAEPSFSEVGSERFKLSYYGMVEPQLPSDPYFQPWYFVVVGIVLVGAGVLLKFRKVAS